MCSGIVGHVCCVSKGSYVGVLEKVSRFSLSSQVTVIIIFGRTGKGAIIFTHSVYTELNMCMIKSNIKRERIHVSG